MKSLGLYLHIPFCRSKCAYCDFYSLPGNDGRMDRYCSALLRELAAWGTKATDYQVDTLYIGGGTPSWFGAERLLQILDGVRQSFFLTADCQITLEANPDSVRAKELKELRIAGVNRISLGAQSAQEEELLAAGRPHTFAQTQAAVAAAREAGFSDLSLDLIYGLPGQTMESWQRSVEAILALEPEHLSCYGLKLEEGTPFWRDQDKIAFPDEDAQADAYLWLCERMKQAGFSHYEISNFARPGCASRHNLKYWTLGEYLGLGPAAYSDFQGERFGYARDLDGYLREDCPLEERRLIPGEERLEEYVMLGLRLERGINARDYLARGGIGWEKLEQEFHLLAAHGLMVEDQGRWHCTPRGFLLSNQIIGAVLDLAQYWDLDLT